MENEKLNLDSIVKKGKYSGKTIDEIIKEDRSEIINMVKKGYSFEGEVYEKARYKHTIRDVNTVLEIVDKPQCNAVKTLSKDTEKLENIIESLSTVDSTSYNEEDNDGGETGDFNMEY